MATRRKSFKAKREAPSDKHQYAAFIADLLDGTVKASKLVESRDGRGRLVLDYDDPNG